MGVKMDGAHVYKIQSLSVSGKGLKWNVKMIVRKFVKKVFIFLV